MQFSPNLTPTSGGKGPEVEPMQTGQMPSPETTEIVHEKGKEIIGAGLGAPAKAELSKEAISATPPTRGIWQNIVLFFHRHFSSILPEENRNAGEIKQLLSDTENEIKKIYLFQQRTRYGEKKLKGSFPSDQTIDNQQHFLQLAKPHLLKAQEILGNLLEKKELSRELAAAHSTFDSLPDAIDELEKSVHLLEGRVRIGEALIELEQSMKDYKPDETWEQFTVVADKRHALYQLLKDLAANNPALKENVQLAKLAEKPSMNASDAYHAIANAFPDLQLHMERLFDATLGMIHQRIDRLDHQVDEALPLFTQYKKNSRNIDALEVHIHSATVMQKIYRLFHGSEELEAQLDQAEKEGRRIFELIEEKCQFNDEELKWLGERKLYTPKVGALLADIETLRKGLNVIEKRVPLSNMIGHLIQHLTDYHDARHTALHARTPEFKEQTAASVQTLKDTIKPELAFLVPYLLQFRTEREEELPANYDALDAVSQANILIPLTFPSLRVKTEILMELIREEQFSETFETMLIEGMESAEMPDVSMKAPESPLPRPSTEERSPPASKAPSPPNRKGEAPSPAPILDAEVKPPPPPPPPMPRPPASREKAQPEAQETEDLPLKYGAIEGEHARQPSLADQLRSKLEERKVSDSLPQNVEEAAKEPLKVAPLPPPPPERNEQSAISRSQDSLKKQISEMRNKLSSEKDRTRPADQLRGFDELMKLLQSGKISFSDIKKEELDQIDSMRQAALKFAKANPDELPDEETDEDWL